MGLFLLFLALYESVRILALHFYRERRNLRVLKIAKPSLRLFLINPYTFLPSSLKPIQLYPNNQHKYTQSNPYLTNPSSIPLSISSLRLIFMGLDICMSMSLWAIFCQCKTEIDVLEFCLHLSYGFGLFVGFSMLGIDSYYSATFLLCQYLLISIQETLMLSFLAP